MRVERISPATERAALAYLERAPYDNVFVTYLLLHEFSAATRAKVVVVLDAGGAVRGVGYFGRQLALASDDEALDALGEHAKRHRGERMIIGPREAVIGFWERIARWHAPPRLVRDRQLVMSLDRDGLQPYDKRVTVRYARIEEWTAVADSSAQMIAQELEYDPRRAAGDFAANVRHMIERRMWWVGESLGRLCFFCNVGPWCRHTVQLQGIWTPPSLRGQGLAAASLAAICDRLLAETPTISLYVNDFNQPAIALYQRVGFHLAGEYQTILF
jgi:RimJ/RimL family protein N-acetyltransferase